MAGRCSADPAVADAIDSHVGHHQDRKSIDDLSIGPTLSGTAVDPAGRR